MTIEAPFEINRGSPSLSPEFEDWLPVAGYEGSYEVSSDGRVRSSTRTVAAKSGSTRTIKGRLISPRMNNGGYLIVTLSDDSDKRTKLVHRLVCEAFHGPAPQDKPNALHGDGNCRNNDASNLRWGDQSDNLKDAIGHGTYTSPQSLKTECKRGHSFTEDNTYTPPSGGRYCRECRSLYLGTMRRNYDRR